MCTHMPYAVQGKEAVAVWRERGSTGTGNLQLDMPLLHLSKQSQQSTSDKIRDSSKHE